MKFTFSMKIVCNGLKNPMKGRFIIDAKDKEEAKREAAIIERLTNMSIRLTQITIDTSSYEQLN